MYFLKLRRLFPIHRFGCLWFPMIRDEIFDALIRKQPYEQYEIRFIQSFLKEGNVFLDIGANFGLYSIIASKIVGKKGTVISIEPEPRNIKRLKRNIFLNHVSVDIIPVALGETEGQVEFSSCGQGAYSGLRVSNVPGEIEKITVNQTTLDCLSEKFHWPEISFVKMDVEGAELLVLNGGRKFFGQFPRQIIMCEFSDRRAEIYGYKSSAVYKRLESLNYVWFNINQDSKLTSCPMKEGYEYENLLACPEEKLALLNSWSS